MKPRHLKSARLRLGWGQTQAARRLGVSQPYLAMLEEGKRRLTPELTRKAALAYKLPLVELPLPRPYEHPGHVGPERLVENLSSLGYPGFAYVRTRAEKRNPAEVLLTALAQEGLEARVAEGLPWLLLRYWQMNFAWLVEQAKRFDLQNRLGFVTILALRVSEKTPAADRTTALSSLEAMLDRSRLAREDFLARRPHSDTEREWLRQNRPSEARHWNLLSDMRPEHLQYAG
jgi:transcriptional regulator with XRE-family HTH domain